MELINNEYSNIFTRFIHKIKYYWLKIWSSKLYTFLLLAFILFIVLAFTMAYPAYYNSLLNIASDDIIQYYPFAGGLFEKLKSGTFSLFDKNLNLGVSVFSGLYYLPLDIFTFIAFLFSYIIPGEIAMAGCNLIRVMVGALIFYYVLVRHMSNKVAFFGGLILFISGMTEAYYIFPVYLGILTYAPLAMLVVDLCLDKKGKFYLLVPIYVMIVVFYDFYIAYMLIGFLCIYYVVKSHIDNKFSFFGKNTIFKNGKFWIRFLEFMGMVFLGLLMSLFVLMPSVYYILNESNRSNFDKANESIWFFSQTVDGEYKISWRHYFTQFINLFMSNEPHRFCLVDPGDYIREHATLYLTSGGLIYFVYFFFIFRKKENRYKLWVILFNILLLIPLFSIILGLNSTPYVRWFFIPYMLNIYAMALGMSDMEFKLGKKNIIKIFPMIILSVGIFMLSFVLIKNPDVFIHYHVDDQFYYPILITSIVLNSLYVLILLVAFIFKIFKKESNVFIIIFKVILFVEVLFAGTVIFINTGNSNSYYIDAKTSMLNEMDHLKELGYDESDGYRVNLFTNYARSTTNANGIVGANFGRYFQSFYSVNINALYSNIYSDYSTGWGRVFNYGYTLVNGPIFNMKYIVTESKENIELPDRYYTKSTYFNNYTKQDEDYYILKDDIPFIVYDKGYTSPTSLGAFERQASLLEYAFIDKPKNTIDELKEKKDNYGQSLYESYGAIVDSKFNIVDVTDVSKYISNYVKKIYITTDKIEYNEYRVYDLTKNSIKNVLDGMDAIYVWPSSSGFRNEEFAYMYIREKNKNNEALVDTEENYGNLHQMHYNETYINNYTPTQLLIQYKKDEYSSGVDLYGYKYELYNNFINNQNKYTNKYFSLDGSKMKIKCDMPDNSKTRIIKTGFSYSNDWVSADSKYELVAVDGAFLGVIVPEGTSSVDLTIYYKPKGYYDGLAISSAAIIIYIMIMTLSFGTIVLKRKDLIL